MKIISVLLLSLFVLLFSACEQQKSAPTEAASSPIQEAQKSHTTTKEVGNKPGGANTDSPTKVESSENKLVVTPAQTAEQSLAEIANHGREITKTQESKTRTRAQLAEDEMQEDLKKIK